MDLFTFARVRLRLSKREFYGLTPRLFFKLHAAYLDERREMHRLAALIRVDMINHSVRAPRKPIELEDLMPAPAGMPTARPAARSGRPRRLNKKLRQEIADSVRRMFMPMCNLE